jgi:hypothetical protein
MADREADDSRADGIDCPNHGTGVGIESGAVRQ